MKLTFESHLERVIRLAGSCSLFTISQIMVTEDQRKVFDELESLIEAGKIVQKASAGRMTLYSTPDANVKHEKEEKPSEGFKEEDVDQWMGLIRDEWGKHDRKFTANKVAKLIGKSRDLTQKLIDQMIDEGRIEKLEKRGKYMGFDFDYYKQL